MTKSYKNLGLKVPDSFVSPGGRMPGEKVRIIEENSLPDFKCFKKSPAEKAQLKAAKMQSKIDEMRR
jgi:hypothetical protein